MALFEVKPYDRQFYAENLRDFLPPQIIDIHTHVWLDSFHNPEGGGRGDRVVLWPSLVAKDNSAEDLIETYRLMFPDKKVTPTVFGNPQPHDDLRLANRYVAESAGKYGFYPFYFSHPAEPAEPFEQSVLAGKFLGVKSYLNLAPDYIPQGEIRIYDFFPPHQLEVINRHGWLMMLHIPRDGRLRDRVNLAQMVEIEEKYPNIKLIIAHVGRAYAEEDVGDAFEVLSGCKKMLFDITANANAQVFEQLLRAVGPDRVLFGSDMPILRLRARRIVENGKYVNLVPPGLYGDVSTDSHMREVSPAEAEKITFFMYEEIYAFKKAAEAAGLTPAEVEKVFYGNAKRLLDAVKHETYGE